ncbi:cell wall-binding repeat-containing protein [Catenulispora pinisilvae]|uniref:cell wall-binding repeat-containing protein n=1 Tax=Catenulispora pinisilvae TaxID=2705253 RepID=UPI001890D58B|nr:cell wall-binding repeat-containing protein [Catenulispora pinisilvae]
MSLTGLGVLSLIGAAVLGGPSAAAASGPGASLVLTRWQGPDRYSTAAALAEAAYPGGSANVVVASGETFPDALSASYLAGYLHAPILLTLATSLPQETSAALARLGAHHVYLVGGTAAVGNAVATRLRANPGITDVRRLSGPTRFDTSLAVASLPPASAVGQVNGVPTAFLASGATFPDALAGSAVAAGAGLPILLTDPHTLSSQVSTAVHRLGIRQVVILGGPAAVVPGIQAALDREGVTTKRLAGADRGATASAIAAFAVGTVGFSPAGISFARGDNAGGGVDALALGALAGVRREPLLLADSPTVAGSSTAAYLRVAGGSMTAGDVAGGRSAISDALMAQLIADAEQAPPSSTTLRVQLMDLPAGLRGNLTVTGPNGYQTHLTSTTTLSGLIPGAYEVTAGMVKDSAGTTYAATQSTQTLAVTAGSAHTVTVDYFDQIPATTKAIDPGTVTAVGATSVTLTGASAVAAGDTIAVGVGPATPDGLLVKVDSVTNGGAGVQNLTTEPGVLTDAITQGDFSADTALPEESPGDLGPAPATNASVKRSAARTDVGPGDLNDVLNCGANGIISLYGQLDASIHPAIHANWSLFHGISVTATATASETASFQADASGDATCTLEVPISPQVTMGRIVFDVGPIPIVIVPKLQFIAHASASVNGDANSSITQKFSATAGLAVNGGSVSPIDSISNSITYVPPGLTANASAKASVGPDVTLALYGIAGPVINVDAGLDLEANTNNSPWWTLDGTLQAGASLKIPALHIDASDDHVISLSKRLAQAGSIGIIPTELVQGAPIGQPYSQQLTGIGGTTPYTFTITNGSLPPGMSLSPGGLISGTPTASTGGPVDTFTVTVHDAHGAQGSQQYTLYEGCGGLAVPQSMKATPDGC